MRHHSRVALSLILVLGWFAITHAGDRSDRGDQRDQGRPGARAARASTTIRGFDPLRGSLARSEPQSIYGRDTNDAWNQVFFLLFTRTVPASVAADSTTDGAPIFPAGDSRLALSGRRVTRIESGDRAIDPLYPSWLWMGSTAFDFAPDRPWRILRHPQYSRLVTALEDVRRTAASRPPLARALMQADLWSAYDMLHGPAATGRGWFRSPPDGAEREREERARTLLTTIATTMRALALSREEIARLPDNYAEAARASKLPDLFGNPDHHQAEADWIEIRWLTHRSHDVAVNYRRAARVFVQPAARPNDTTAFLQRLRDHGSGAGAQGSSEGAEALRSVALLTQLLLLSSDGTVVPSPITYQVQFRGAAARSSGTEIPQYELSRQRLLSSPASGGGGLVGVAADMPSYLPIAGNDFSFATSTRLDGDPVVAPLTTRCTICHGAGIDIGRFATFAFHAKPGRQVTRLVSAENVHSNDVARKKMEQEDFKSLREHWR